MSLRIVHSSCRSNSQHDTMIFLLMNAPSRGGGGSTPADVTVPAQGTALFYDRLVLSGAFRLVAGAAVGADRVFYVSRQEIYMRD